MRKALPGAWGVVFSRPHDASSLHARVGPPDADISSELEADTAVRTHHGKLDELRRTWSPLRDGRGGGNAVSGRGNSASAGATAAVAGIARAPVIVRDAQGTEWVVVRDAASGGVYCWNRATGATTWELPGRAGPAAARAAHPASAARVPWRAVIDPETGGTYYWHTMTGETSWSTPAALGEGDVAVGSSGNGAVVGPVAALGGGGVGPAPLDNSGLRTALNNTVDWAVSGNLLSRNAMNLTEAAGSDGRASRDHSSPRARGAGPARTTPSSAFARVAGSRLGAGSVTLLEAVSSDAAKVAVRQAATVTPPSPEARGGLTGGAATARGPSMTCNHDDWEALTDAKGRTFWYSACRNSAQWNPLAVCVGGDGVGGDGDSNSGGGVDVVRRTPAAVSVAALTESEKYSGPMLDMSLSQMPDDWIALVDPKGRPYYYSAARRVTQWTSPALRTANGSPILSPPSSSGYGGDRNAATSAGIGSLADVPADGVLVPSVSLASPLRTARSEALVLSHGMGVISCIGGALDSSGVGSACVECADVSVVSVTAHCDGDARDGGSDWVQLRDVKGRVYYYSEQRRVTQWHDPHGTRREVCELCDSGLSLHSVVIASERRVAAGEGLASLDGHGADAGRDRMAPETCEAMEYSGGVQRDAVAPQLTEPSGAVSDRVDMASAGPSQDLAGALAAVHGGAAAPRGHDVGSVVVLDEGAAVTSLGFAAVHTSYLPVGDGDGDMLTSEWQEVVDSVLNCAYYYNVNTKVSSWVRPRIGAISLVPPAEPPPHSLEMQHMLLQEAEVVQRAALARHLGEQHRKQKDAHFSLRGLRKDRVPYPVPSASPVAGLMCSSPTSVEGSSDAPGAAAADPMNAGEDAGVGSVILDAAVPLATGTSAPDGGLAVNDDDARPLPPGWEEVIDDETGVSFYYCDETDESTWERPAAGRALPARGAPESEPLPAGWEEVFDEETSAVYFWCAETDDASWSRPCADRAVPDDGGRVPEPEQPRASANLTTQPRGGTELTDVTAHGLHLQDAKGGDAGLELNTRAKIVFQHLGHSLEDAVSVDDLVQGARNDPMVADMFGTMRAIWYALMHIFSLCRVAARRA